MPQGNQTKGRIFVQFFMPIKSKDGSNNDLSYFASSESDFNAWGEGLSDYGVKICINIQIRHIWSGFILRKC